MTGRSLTAREAREELYDIIRGEGVFEAKAEAALGVGKRFLGADSAYLARVDTDREYWEVLVSTDSFDGANPTGEGIDFEMSYCRRTVASGGQIALHDAPNQGWADDPAFEAQGLHCYHGTTLIVDDEPYGAVCFVAEDPRAEFGECESLFAELVARLLERELERQQHETELTRQANLATVLNRVLRHNLRNKLSVIRGYTQLMADELKEDAYSEPALDSIDALMQLSQKARQLDQVIAADVEYDSVDLTAVVSTVAETVSQAYPEATLSVECSGPITADVLPSFERAVTELVENAAKHGDQPTVTVSVESAPNAVEIRITDDGPGLADLEADVLEAGSETPLTHGSGLGLWLTHWIVTSHDGTISATVAEDGTTMTITVPQTATTTTTQQSHRELSQARDLYQAVFEEASNAMTIVDTDGRIIDANPEAKNIYGVDHRELLGRSIAEFLPPEFDFDAAWRSFQTVDVEHDSVVIEGGDGIDRLVDYTGTTDIIPGYHLIVSRTITDSANFEATADAEQLS